FSLGSVLYRMTTGALPFPAESSAGMLLALVQDDPVPPAQLNPSIPPALGALVLRLLAKDPAARPGSAHDAAGAFRELDQDAAPAPAELLDLHVHVDETDALQPRAPRPRPRARAATFAAVAVVAALAAGAMLLPRRREPA